RTSALVTVSLLLFLVSCGEAPKKVTDKVGEKITEPDSLPPAPKDSVDKAGTDAQKEPFLLTEENAIDFFFNYGKELKEDRVKITTSMGSFTVELYDNVPYHKANFIFLAKKHYFDSTQFHRVVKDFIIQGGSTDDREIMG